MIYKARMYTLNIRILSVPNSVYALFLLFFLSSVFFTDAFAANKTFSGAGSFSNALLWDLNTLPVAGDNITINGNCTVDNNAATDNVAYGNLVIGLTTAGTVTWPVGGTNTLSVVDMTASFAGSTLNMTNGGTLILAGDWINTNLTFTPGTGTIERQLAGLAMGATSTFNNLIINTSGTISSTISITINGNMTIRSGIFSVGAYSLTIAGTTTLIGTLTITSATGSKSFNNLILNNGTFNNTAANEAITITGDFQNNGTFNSGTGLVTFTGAASTTISGASTTAFGGGITVNKGTSAATILDVQGIITFPANTLTITNGTFKLSSASTLAINSNINATQGLWNNGGTINFPAGTVMDFWGLIQSSAGIMNIGVNADDRLEPRAGCSIVIEGGTVNVAGRIGRGLNPAYNFTMSGGVLNVNTVGSTSGSLAPFHLSGTSSFNMSGGTIVIHQAGGGNLGFNNEATGTTSVTGGIIQIGDATTPAGQTINIYSTVPLWNLVVNGSNSPVAFLTTALTVNNNITIITGSLNANNQNITVGNDWTNNGTFIPGTGTVTFTSTLIQTITNSAGETFYKLTANTTGILKLANNVMVTNTLAMTSGNINLNGKTLTLGNSAGATLTHAGATATVYGGTFKRWWPVGAISSSSGPLYGLFPVGAAYDYRLVEVNSTVNPTTAGYVSATHTDAVTITDVTYTDNEGDDIERIQNMKSSLSTSGLAGGTYNIAIKYTCLSATGLLPRMKLETYTGGIMGSIGTGGVTNGPLTAPTVKRNGLTMGQLSNDFVVGSKDKVTTPLTQYYYSRKTGNATDNTTWSYTGGGAGASCACWPSSDGYIVISAGQTVTQDAPGTMAYIDISSGATVIGTFSADITNDLTTIGTGKFTTTTGTLTVGRDLYVSATSISSIPSGGMTIGMDLNVNGVLDLGANTLTLNGIGKTISGTGSITGNGTLSITTGNKTIASGSTLTIAPTVAITGAITVNNSGTVTLSGDLTGSVAGSTWTNDENSTLNVAGAILTTGTLNSIAANSVVNYNGSGAQTIKIPSSTYHNLTCSNSGTKTLGGGTLRVANLLTLSNAAILDAATNNLNGTGGLTMNNTSRLILGDVTAGNQPQPLFTGTYTLASGTTIEFDGGDAQNARGAAYQNVAISGNNIASSVNMANVSAILGNLSFTNMGQMNSNAALTISGNLSYGSSGTTTAVNAITVNGTSGSSFTAGSFDMNGENLTTYSLGLAGGTLSGGSGIINITTGNWTISSGTFTAGAGTVKFSSSGATTQTLGGALPTTFYNLTIDNTGTGGVTQGTGATVSNTMTLTNGKYLLNSLTLIISKAATTAIGRTNGYIVSENTGNLGKIRWSMSSTTGAHIYPFGTASGSYIPFTFNVTAGTPRNVTVSTYPTASNNTPYPSAPILVANMMGSGNQDNSANVVDRFWQIDKTGPSGTVTLTFTATAAEVGTVLSLTAQRYDVSTNLWQAPLTGQTNTATSATVPGVTTFSPWTMSSSAAILPIELLSFTATLNDTHVDLGWSTASELNNDYFTIEKTLDFENYETVAIVNGAGNSMHTLNYFDIDQHPYSGISYYRLKQTDFNGTVSYSNIVPIDMKSIADFEMNVFPNPATSNLIISIMGAPGKEVSLVISDVLGRECYSKVITEENSNYSFAVDLHSHLAIGQYLVTMSCGTMKKTRKLIVN